MTAKRLSGFLLLAATSGLLYYCALREGLASGALLGTVLGAVLVALVYGFRLEAPAVKAPAQGPVSPKKDLCLFCAVLSGAVVSYWLNVDMKLGAVIAAALVGVAAAVIVPGYAVPLYCGSFVGMASPKVLNHAQALLAGVAAGIIYVLAQDVFNGFGGKLGTIACAGCCVAATLSGRSLLSSPVPPWEIGKKIILTSVASAVAAYCINVRMGKGAVMGSAIVGLAGGLILPSLLPGAGATLATACICASFAGMSSRARIPNETLIAVAGALAGLVFMYSSPCLGGAGGKLGTTAFGSVIVVNAAYKVAERFASKKT